MKFELVQLAAHIIFRHFHALDAKEWQRSGAEGLGVEKWVVKEWVDENYQDEVTAWVSKHFQKLRDQNKSLFRQYHPRAIPKDVLRPECRIPLPPPSASFLCAGKEHCLFEEIWSVDRPERFEITLRDECQKKDLKIILFSLSEHLRKKTHFSLNNKEALKKISYALNINSFTTMADLLFLLTLIGLETNRLHPDEKISGFLRNYLSRYMNKAIEDDDVWRILCGEFIQGIIKRKLIFTSHYSFKKYIKKSMSGLRRSFKRKLAYAAFGESRIFSSSKSYETSKGSVKKSVTGLYKSFRQKQEEHTSSDQSDYQIFRSPTGYEIGRGIDRIALDWPGISRDKIYRLIRNGRLSAIKVKNNLVLNKEGVEELKSIVGRNLLLKKDIRKMAAKRDIKPDSARRFFRRKHLKSSGRIDKNLPRT